MEAIKHLSLLGLRVRDKVSGYTGIVASIDFQLYGCIQADVRSSGLDKDGQPKQGYWVDLNRLEIIDNTPIMARPNFSYGPVAEAQQGCDLQNSKGRSI